MPGRTQPWRLLGLLALAALLGGAAAQAPSPAPLPSERPVPSVAAAPAAADAEADALAVEAAAPLDNSTDLYGGRTINICTSDYFPISRCLDRDAAEFTGCAAGRQGRGPLRLPRHMHGRRHWSRMLPVDSELATALERPRFKETESVHACKAAAAAGPGRRGLPPPLPLPCPAPAATTWPSWSA